MEWVQLAMQQASTTVEYAHLLVAAAAAWATVQAQTTKLTLELPSRHVAQVVATTPATTLVAVLQDEPTYQAQHPTPINVLALPAHYLHGDQPWHLDIVGIQVLLPATQVPDQVI